MNKDSVYSKIQADLEDLRGKGLYKEERIITSQQSCEITVKGGSRVINLCANNYLGLANNSSLIAAGCEGLEKYGFGMASVRFICGTLDIHKELESQLSEFLGFEDTILFPSCFDANGGLFEALLGPEDAVVSDELNHASIIDGIRLCKAKRYRYRNNDSEDLEAQLKLAREAGCNRIVVATDGVFSMDGIIANLSAICDIAEAYGALVMVDDCHATGFLGATGRGTHEYNNVMGRVDIMTGTLGKALGGASGGYISARKEVVEWLRQRARPYLFSNTIAPAIVYASLKVLDLVRNGDDLRMKLRENSSFFRQEMSSLGFDLIPGDHPIIPVMIGDATKAQELSRVLLSEGVYVIGFSYPVVPMGKARIRTQMSAGVDQGQLERAVAAFARAGRSLGLIK
jgi:glycine C-acetyltransferase